MRRYKFRDLARLGYADSIVRRSLLLLCLIGPAFGINLALYFVASLLLSADDFGRLYIGITAENVLYSASFVLNIFFTRYLVSVIRSGGEPLAYAARRKLQRIVAAWGALGALTSLIVLSAFGKWIGVESWPIVVLIVLDAYASYIVDVDRALLQSLRKTMSLGAVTLSWMTLRLLLGTTAMLSVGTAWSGMLGTFAGTILIITILSSPFSFKAHRPIEVAPPLPSARALLAVISGYVTLIGVSNLDVLLSYLILRDEALGVYSGSSVFPKGILVFVTPLLQMLYPIMAGHERAPTQVKIIFQKSVAVVLLLAAGMALVVLALSQLVCGTSWGLQSCRPGPLQTLLISAVSLSGLRALVFYNSACGRDWIAVSMLLPAAGYTWIALLSPQSVDTVAVQFTTFCLLLLPYYWTMVLLSDRAAAAMRRGRTATN